MSDKNLVENSLVEGLLILNKPRGVTSFNLVYRLRKSLGVKKIGHAGTLDPFATGVMVMLIGRNYTKLSDQFLNCRKKYLAKLFLGVETDSFDIDGQETSRSSYVPTLSEVQKAIQEYQGDIWQVPPMFSAKKKDGVRLYKLARSGVEIAREPVLVNFSSNLVHYSYPYLTIEVECSKGTYIRSIAKSLGEILKCGAHLSELTRTESGSFSLTDSLSADLIESNPNLVMQSLKKGF